jgi:multidrug efflux pump subunit AcrA (membrane-fusion protein)/beta-lactamase regulating signal transducer with metallopeptidase domain
MTTTQFLAEWALRSSILILSGALLLWALRVKDSSIRLAAWTAILFGSLAIPALTAALPKVPLIVTRTATRTVEARVVRDESTPSPEPPASRQNGTGVSKRFDWARAAVTIYVLIGLALLLRLCVGLTISLRLLRGSRATGQSTGGIEIRESDRVAAPVALGIVRPAIVLPGDWRQWDGARLDAVLAHERSHIRRHDPAVQLISAIHRALLWHSPLSWFLHRRIVRVAEEASDDAAVAVTRDPAFYAEVLLGFLQRGAGRANQPGVPMARYGRPEQRIDRILAGRALSRGITRRSVAAILALGSPLAYLVAAAHPQSAAEVQTPEVDTPEVQPAPAQAIPVQAGVEQPAPPIVAQTAPQPAARAKPDAAPVYLNGLGTVAAFYTVRVRSRLDGQLMSVGFSEGEQVREGQLLVSIDPRPYQIQLDRAQSQLAEDQALLADARRAQDAILISQLEGRTRTDQANIENAKLQLIYTQIRAPITGVAGLRLVDPGNIVHAADSTGIVIITQLQPIGVVIAIPEDVLPQVRARMREGASLTVEAWNRDNTIKLATGRLTAVDNQIDQTTGTVKLKALFDNKDEALFPNQFVNVRLFSGGR